MWYIRIGIVKYEQTSLILGCQLPSVVVCTLIPLAWPVPELSIRLPVLRSVSVELSGKQEIIANRDNLKITMKLANSNSILGRCIFFREVLHGNFIGHLFVYNK
jgi:hypothetical protein